MDPNHEPLGDTTRLREPVPPLTSYGIICNLSLLSRLSLAPSYIVLILLFFQALEKDQRGRLHNDLSSLEKSGNWLIYSTGAYNSVEREDASEEREKYDKDMKELRQQPS